MKKANQSRRTQKAKTRLRIIEAGKYILANDTFKAFTMRGIAKRAKIAQPSFYNHFNSVEALLEAIIEEGRLNIIKPQADAMLAISKQSSLAEIETAIHHFIRLAFDMAIQHPNFFCMTLSERNLRGSPLEKILHREFQHVRQLYIDFFLNVAKKQGVTVTDEQTELGVDAILGSNEALITGYIEGRYKSKENAIAMATQIIINQIRPVFNQ